MPPTRGYASEFGLRDYIEVIRRRRGTILLVVLLLTVPTVTLSVLETPVYAGQAELLLLPRNSERIFDVNTGVGPDPARQVQNEIRIITSEPVRAAVRERIGDAPKVSAQADAQTDIIRVTARSTDPERAAESANAYADSYITFRRTQAVDDVLAASRQVQSKITELQGQIDQAPADQRDELVAAQALFKQKLDQLQVEAALKQGGAQLVTPATTPTSPVSPKPVRTGVLTLFIGLVFGLGLAFLRDFLDDSIKSKEDFERVAGDLPVLGLIPVIGGWRDRDQPTVVSITEPNSQSAESFRTLRTSIQFLGLERPIRTMQITSARPKEGKTTTVANLGVALARSGLRVVIVCCDLRRPRIHEFFGLDNQIGFTSVLLGKVPVRDAVQSVPEQDRLFLLASGPLPPNPSELLASRRTVEVFTSLQVEHDIVLIDCPPVIPVTDALVLSGRVDATLVVSVAGATTRNEVARVVELLRQVDAPLVGAVLNGADAKGSGGYGYDSYLYESHGAGSRQSKRNK